MSDQNGRYPIIGGYAEAERLIRTAAPLWLEEAGLTAQAAALRGLAPITDGTTARAAKLTVWAVSRATKAALARAEGKALYAHNAGEIATWTLGESWSTSLTSAWSAVGEADMPCARGIVLASISIVMLTVADAAVVAAKADARLGSATAEGARFAAREAMWAAARKGIAATVR